MTNDTSTWPHRFDSPSPPMPQHGTGTLRASILLRSKKNNKLLSCKQSRFERGVAIIACGVEKEILENSCLVND